MFPKRKNLDFLCSLFPKIAFVPLFLSCLNFYSLVPLKKMALFLCCQKPLGGPHKCLFVAGYLPLVLKSVGPSLWSTTATVSIWFWWNFTEIISMMSSIVCELSLPHKNHWELCLSHKYGQEFSLSHKYDWEFSLSHKYDQELSLSNL